MRCCPSRCCCEGQGASVTTEPAPGFDPTDGFLDRQEGTAVPRVVEHEQSQARAMEDREHSLEDLLERHNEEKEREEAQRRKREKQQEEEAEWIRQQEAEKKQNCGHSPALVPRDGTSTENDEMGFQQERDERLEVATEEERRQRLIEAEEEEWKRQREAEVAAIALLSKQPAHDPMSRATTLNSRCDSLLNQTMPDLSKIERWDKMEEIDRFATQQGLTALLSAYTKKSVTGKILAKARALDASDEADVKVVVDPENKMLQIIGVNENDENLSPECVPDVLVPATSVTAILSSSEATALTAAVQPEEEDCALLLEVMQTRKTLLIFKRPVDADVTAAVIAVMRSLLDEPGEFSEEGRSPVDATLVFEPRRFVRSAICAAAPEFSHWQNSMDLFRTKDNRPIDLADLSSRSVQQPGKCPYPIPSPSAVYRGQSAIPPLFLQQQELPYTAATIVSPRSSTVSPQSARSHPQTPSEEASWISGTPLAFPKYSRPVLGTPRTIRELMLLTRTGAPLLCYPGPGRENHSAPSASPFFNPEVQPQPKVAMETHQASTSFRIHPETNSSFKRGRVQCAGEADPSVTGSTTTFATWQSFELPSLDVTNHNKLSENLVTNSSAKAARKFRDIGVGTDTLKTYGAPPNGSLSLERFALPELSANSSLLNSRRCSKKSQPSSPSPIYSPREKRKKEYARVLRVGKDIERVASKGPTSPKRKVPLLPLGHRGGSGPTEYPSAPLLSPAPKTGIPREVWVHPEFMEEPPSWRHARRPRTPKTTRAETSRAGVSRTENSNFSEPLGLRRLRTVEMRRRASSESIPSADRPPVTARAGRMGLYTYEGVKDTTGSIRVRKFLPGYDQPQEHLLSSRPSTKGREAARSPQITKETRHAKDGHSSPHNAIVPRSESPKRRQSKSYPQLGDHSRPNDKIGALVRPMSRIVPGDAIDPMRVNPVGQKRGSVIATNGVLRFAPGAVQQDIPTALEGGNVRKLPKHREGPLTPEGIDLNGLHPVDLRFKNLLRKFEDGSTKTGLTPYDSVPVATDTLRYPTANLGTLRVPLRKTSVKTIGSDFDRIPDTDLSGVELSAESDDVAKIMPRTPSREFALRLLEEQTEKNRVSASPASSATTPVSSNRSTPRVPFGLPPPDDKKFRDPLESMSAVERDALHEAEMKRKAEIRAKIYSPTPFTGLMAGNLPKRIE